MAIDASRYRATNHASTLSPGDAARGGPGAPPPNPLAAPPRASRMRPPGTGPARPGRPAPWRKAHPMVEIGKRILFVGYGAVAQCTLPILMKVAKVNPRNVTVMDFEDR